MDNNNQKFDENFWNEKVIEYGVINNNDTQVNPIKINNIDEYISNNYSLKNVDVELLKKNKKKIFIKIQHDLPKSWEDNIDLFELCIEENRLDLASKFKIDFSYDILKKYNYCIKHIIDVIFPDSWQKQPLFLDYLFKNNYFDILKRISFDYIDKELLDKYTEKILFIIKDDFPESLMYNSYLFELCCSRNEKSLLSNFYINNISQEVLNKYTDVIIPYIEDNIENGMTQYNSNLLEFCIKNNRNDLVSKFPSSTFTTDMLEEYKNVIFDIIKNQSEMNTWNYDYNIYALCKNNNRDDLLPKFPKFHYGSLDNELNSKMNDLSSEINNQNIDDKKGDIENE